MKIITNNPAFILLLRLLKSKLLQYKNTDKRLKLNFLSTAENCVFGQYNTIYYHSILKDVELGDFTYIAVRTEIMRAKIGKFCSIGPDCRIGLRKHPASDFVSTHPIFFSNLKQSQISFADKNYFEEEELNYISIGNDVWIGSNSIVLDGVNIADGVIVAAGSVVTKDIPPYAIVGGVPAKIIRYRFEKEEIEKLLKIKWWDKDIDYLRNNFKMFHDIKKFNLK